ncbi:MAG: hypothetical protein JO320_15770 [Alphaproteobacteria bacterium]|nr:hypothetical protein [Alphaproteobacteria bacterium]MBV9251205.1 hypothetical protein [Acetobacteraceae bacterium]MBV9376490.1 hypothetical protein [Alphaproteobacteria bacterium]
MDDSLGGSGGGERMSKAKARLSINADATQHAVPLKGKQGEEEAIHAEADSAGGEFGESDDR